MGTLKKWDRLSEIEKKQATDDLIYYFDNDRGEEIGFVAANQLLDFFLEHVGSKLYNKGITDAKLCLENRFNDFGYELDDLLDV